MSSTDQASSSCNTMNVRRILCYGDSLTAGTSEYPFELFPYAPHLEMTLNSHHKKTHAFVVRHRGMPGWTADAMVDAADDPNCGLRSAIQAIQDPSISCVIIMAGTNDLGYAAAYSGKAKIDKILRPITQLHEMAWAAGVPRTIAIAIPPSGYQAQVKEAASLAATINGEIKAFCEASQGKATYVPFPFDFERNGTNWASDTLHFSPDGYQTLGEQLAEPVSKVMETLSS